MKRILVVEDNEANMYLCTRILTAHKFEVIQATNGKEAIEIAKTEKPDLILLDLMLPKIDGYWVCNLLKHDKRHEHIPIIIITAKSGEENVKLAMDCGADAYMVKPFEIQELLAKIASLLKK